jgi:hypothetical protein
MPATRADQQATEGRADDSDDLVGYRQRGEDATRVLPAGALGLGAQQ